MDYLDDMAKYHATVGALMREAMLQVALEIGDEAFRDEVAKAAGPSGIFYPSPNALSLIEQRSPGSGCDVADRLEELLEKSWAEDNRIFSTSSARSILKGLASILDGLASIFYPRRIR